MRIALGTDETTPLTDHIGTWLAERGHQVEVVAADRPWPEVGRAVGTAVAGDAADVGVVCCWTGTGVAMAATKVPGVRAALCGDAATAAGARRWNDANVVALSLRLTTATVADEVLEAFLGHAHDPDELAVIADVEPGAG